MAVTIDDVRHVAALARLSLDDERAAALVAELNGILVHMEVLDGVGTATLPAVSGIGARGMPLRADAGPPLPLARAIESFAPRTREGFLLVPRLDTHDDSAEH